MNPVLTFLRDQLFQFLKNEDGPTAVEYAVMLALIIVVCITAITAHEHADALFPHHRLIIVVCITAITALGTNASNTFSFVSGQVQGSGS